MKYTNAEAQKEIDRILAEIAKAPLATPEPGAETPCGGWEYTDKLRAEVAQAEAAIDDLRDGYMGQDLMAGHIIDILDKRLAIALDYAGGWAGVPHVALARLNLHDPQYACPGPAAEEHKRLKAIYKAEIDTLLDLRANQLSDFSPEGRFLDGGDSGPSDPRKRYSYFHAAEELYVWAGEIYRLKVGNVPHVGSFWLARAWGVCHDAGHDLERVRRLEKGCGSLAIEILERGPDALEEEPDMLAKLFGTADGPRRTLEERLKAQAEKLRDARNAYAARPGWALGANGSYIV